MALSQAEIKQLIAEKFPPAGAPNVLGAFGDRAAPSFPIVAADIVFVDAEPAGPEAEQNRRNSALRTQYDEDNAERLASGAGALSGKIRDDMNGKAGERLKRQAEDKKRKARDAEYMMLLQAQIADLEKRLGDLYNERDRLMDRYLSPEERAAVAALPPEKQTDAIKQLMRDKLANGQLTPAEYEQWQTDWDRNEREIRDTKAEIDGKRSELNAGVDRLKQQGEILTIDAKPHTLDVRYSEIAALEKKAGNLEGQKLALGDLENYHGPDRVKMIDEFIAGASATTLELIAQNSESNPVIASRIGLHNFYEELSSLDSFKGTPDYQMYVQIAVDDAPDSVRELLRTETHLSEELATALYKPYSDELDEKPGVETKSAESPTSDSSVKTHDNILVAKPLSLG